MALTNPKIFGLRITNKLTDVEDAEEVLSNLRLELDDLDVIRGSIDQGASRGDFINFSRLSKPIFKTLDRFYEDIKSYESVVLDRASISSILFGNLTISGRLDGSSIRYRYRYVDPDDSSAVPEYRIADISTSRVSSWSSTDNKAGSADLSIQAKARISYGGQVQIVKNTKPDDAPINKAHLVFGTQSDVTGITGKPRLQTSIIPQEKEFDAERPTHTVTVNLDGTDFQLYAMKGIPLIFEGTFRNLSATVKIFKDGDIKPSWKIAEVDNPNAFLNFENVLSNTDSNLNFRSSSSKTRFIQFYYNPFFIRRITLRSANIEALPVAVLDRMDLLNLENNAIKNMPDLKTFAPKMTSLNMRRNPLNNSEDPNERRLNSVVLAKMPDRLRTLTFGSTFYGSINDGTSATASLIYERFKLPADGGTANAQGIRTLNLQRYGGLQYFHKDTADPECHIPNIQDTCVTYNIYRNEFRGIAGGSPIASTNNSNQNKKGRSVSSISAAGSGYSVASSLATTGGSGSGMTVNITAVDGNGAITGIELKSIQSGYLKNDELTIVQTGSGGNGKIKLGSNNNGRNYLFDDSGGAPSYSNYVSSVLDSNEKTIKTCSLLQNLQLSRNYNLTDESFRIDSPVIRFVRMTFTNLPIPNLQTRTNLELFEANHCRNAGHIAYNSGTNDNPNEVYKFNLCTSLRFIYISNSSSLPTGTGTSPNGGLHGAFPKTFTNENLEILRFENTRLQGGIISDDGNKDDGSTFPSDGNVIPDTLFEGFGSKLRDFRISSSYLHVGNVGTNVFTHTPNLEILRIRSNKRIKGNLPNIGGCAKLRYLDFYNNAFDGNVYPLTSNESLSHVYLHVNNLSGVVPGYNNLPNLLRMRLNQNNLTGMNALSLPKCFEFRAHINNMTGSIPTFVNCPKMRFVTLFNNNFTGYTPGAIAQNFQLRLFDVSQNQLGQNALITIIDDLYSNYQASGSSRSVTLNIQNQKGGEDISFPPETVDKINTMTSAGWTIISS